jgi:Ca2+-binding RTX toxin-like protein
VTAVTDGDGGIDWVDAAAVSSSSVIDLRNGSTSTIAGIATVFSGIENAVSGDGADTLIGNSLGNILYGMRGNDTLRGGLGYDTMAGGADSDVFDFNSVAEIGAGFGTRDVITDFQVGIDKIDLDGIDALTTAAGIQHFDWLGTAAHTGTGATLRYIQSAGNTIVQGDVNADGISDFGIQLNGLHTLTAGSFTDPTITNVRGTTAGETLQGSSGAEAILGLGGNDVLFGFGGTDVLAGGAGFDTMTGGGAGDVFDFNSVADIGAGFGTRDVITDFQVGIDKIDLDGIDALTTAAGVQHFGWLGTAAHTGTGATLRYFQSAGNTIVQGDVDADGSSDFAIQLNGLHTLTADSFTDLTITNVRGTGAGETLLGSSGAETILGLGGTDVLLGFSGTDVLIGGAGFDTMTGGGAADVFDFNSVAEIGMGFGTRDVITDFEVGIDKIDLEGIDALTTAAGMQRFTWLGTAAHTGAGATLRYFQSAGNTIVQGDVNADGIKDFAIQLYGMHALTVNDFILTP